MLELIMILVTAGSAEAPATEDACGKDCRILYSNCVHRKAEDVVESGQVYESPAHEIDQECLAKARTGKRGTYMPRRNRFLEIPTFMLYNREYGTEVKLVVPYGGDPLSAAQISRARSTLCGSRPCADRLGRDGEQGEQSKVYMIEEVDGDLFYRRVGAGQ